MYRALKINILSSSKNLYVQITDYWLFVVVLLCCCLKNVFNVVVFVVVVVVVLEVTLTYVYVHTRTILLKELD